MRASVRRVKTRIVAVVAVLAALVTSQAAALNPKTEAAAKTALDKANADANAAKTEAAAARKAVEDQKAELTQARMDIEAAGKFLEVEKMHSARLQQELTLAREQMAYIRGRNTSARFPEGMVPMPVQPQIREIRIAPSSIQGRAVGRGVAAQPAQPTAPGQ